MLVPSNMFNMGNNASINAVKQACENFKVYFYKERDQPAHSAALTIRRFRIDHGECKSYDAVKAKIVQEFPILGKENVNYSILWEDEEKDWISIVSDDGLVIALEETPGRLGKFHIRPKIGEYVDETVGAVEKTTEDTNEGNTGKDTEAVEVEKPTTKDEEIVEADEEKKTTNSVGITQENESSNVNSAAIAVANTAAPVVESGGAVIAGAATAGANALNALAAATARPVSSGAQVASQ